MFAILALASPETVNKGSEPMLSLAIVIDHGFKLADWSDIQF